MCYRDASVCTGNVNDMLRGKVAVEESSGFLKCTIFGLNDNCGRESDTFRKMGKRRLTEPEEDNFTHEPTAVDNLQKVNFRG